MSSSVMKDLEEGSSPPTTKTAWSIVTIEIPKRLSKIADKVRNGISTAKSRSRRTDSLLVKYIMVPCTIVGNIIWGAWSAVMFLNQSAWKIFGPFILMPVKTWEGAFILSCFAVVFDPLFFYIPIVNDTKKCLTTDKTLKTVALILRELTDFLLLTHVILEFKDLVDTEYPKFDHDSHSEPNHPQKKHDDDGDLEVGGVVSGNIYQSASSEPHDRVITHAKSESYITSSTQSTETYELNPPSEPRERGLTHAKTDSHLGSATHTKKENFEHKPGRRKHVTGHDTEYDMPKAGLVQWVKKKIPSWLTASIVIKILALLPVPQVAVLVGFFRLGGGDFSIARKFLNLSLALQYLPRVGQIYLNRSNFRMAGKLAKPSFNFFLYVLASHVLGALWYIFAIERETSCWYKACRKTPGCAIHTFKCGGTPTNITLLNQLCPIDSTNSTLFDFGIFADILESGNTGSDKFTTKLFYSLWWGLKNLSNFGTNLETSNYVWENCFAILICIIGMLLFLYLIGNVQLYITSATEKSLEKERARKDKIKKTYESITQWMSDLFHDEDEENGKTEESKAVETRKKIKQLIKGNKIVEKNLTSTVAVDVSYFLNQVTPPIKRSVSEYLGMAALRKIPFFRDMKDNMLQLKELCHALEPVVQSPNDELIPQGYQLTKMFFILRGQIRHPPDVKKNSWLGQTEIMGWALRNWNKSYYDDLPKSIISTKSSSKVEALGLDATKLLQFLIDKVKLDSPELVKYVQQAPSTSGQTKCAEGEHQKWEAPKSGRVKLNCSHLWEPANKTARLGFLLRDDKGVLLMAKNCIDDHSCIDEFDAAALSIKIAMENQTIRGHNLIDVESDHQLVVNCLSKWEEHKQRVIRSSVREKFETITNQKTSKLTFAYKSNEAARVLADNAKTSQECGVWTHDSTPPEWLQVIMDKEKPVPSNSQEPPKDQPDKIGAEPQTPGGAKGTTGSKVTKASQGRFGIKIGKTGNTAKVDFGGEAASNLDYKTTKLAQPST